MTTRAHVRSIALAVAAIVVLPALGLLGGCGSPAQAVTHCVGAPDNVVQAVQQKLTAKGKLRNAKLVTVPGSPRSFLSAEIHLDTDAKHDKGNIATWVTTDTKNLDDFHAVDVHAREESTWPAARFTVTADGAIESRACTNLTRGKTRAQLRCERDQNSGSLGLPKGTDCGNL
jgi:hypothetical protein